MSAPTAQDHFDGKAGGYHSDIYDGRTRNCHAHNQRVRRQVIGQLLAELGPAGPGARALDIGAGPGAISGHLATLGYVTVAADLSWNMLDAHRAEVRDVTRRAQCSVEALGFRDGAFELVTAAGMLEYVPDQSRALSEIRRVLTPGGSLIVSVPIRTRISTPLRRALRAVRGGQTEPAFHLSYIPRAFLDRLRAAGFIIDRTCSHHYVFFPWDVILPGVSARLDRWITARAGGGSAAAPVARLARLARLAKTLVVQARREP